MPGITTHWRATPDRLGNYPVVCNLLCGLGHSLMRSAVHVVSQETFRSWIASQTAAGSLNGRHGGCTSAPSGSGFVPFPFRYAWCSARSRCRSKPCRD